MIHDQRSASWLGERVSFVLFSHTHHAREGRIADETLLLTEGPTGGAGPHALQGAEPEPLTWSVLYIDSATRRLVAYDRITVRGLGDRAVTIERHVPANASTDRAN